MSEITYKITDATCEGCGNAVKRALAALSGVKDSKFDLKTKNIVVDYDENKIKAEDIKVRIEDVGYNAEDV